MRKKPLQELVSEYRQLEKSIKDKLAKKNLLKEKIKTYNTQPDITLDYDSYVDNLNERINQMITNDKLAILLKKTLVRSKAVS
jgi:hypothetical protein